MKGNNNQLEKNTQPKGEITMKNKMSKILKNEKGLTLIELLAVIVILAIVSAIAIPAIGNIIENSRYNAVKADGSNILSAASLYFTDNPDKTYVTAFDLKAAKYLDSTGKIELDAAAGVVEATSKSFVKIDTDGTKKITTGEITFSGSKKAKFTANSIDSINADKQKGSKVGATTYVIGTVTTD